MVAKISTGGSLASALAYNINKVAKEKAQVLSTNMVYCSSTGEFKTREVLKHFEIFMPKKYRTENPMFHVSLNPHPDGKLSDNELMVIAEEYIEKMGYGDQPYIIFKHEDISRHHIHIVSTRVSEQGKKINDKFERRRSKDITRQLEQKYGLKTAEKAVKPQSSELKTVDVNAGNVKQQVEDAVREVIKKYHFLTFTEYKAVLSKLNITAEEVNGSQYGKPFSGVVYSATDNDDNKVGNPFNSATLGKFAGSEALAKKYATSKEHIEKNRLGSPLRNAIDRSFVGATTKEQLRYNLFENGIGVVYRENEEGRLYGITFIDHNTGAVLNGSRIGKEYAANGIIERLANPITEQDLKHHFKYDIPLRIGGVELTEKQRIDLDSCKSVYVENITSKSGDRYNAFVRLSPEQGKFEFFKKAPDTQHTLQSQQPQQSQSPSSQETQSTTRHSTTTDLISGSTGLFDLPTNNGDNPEEDTFRRRMQQQHKKKKGRRI